MLYDKDTTECNMGLLHFARFVVTRIIHLYRFWSYFCSSLVEMCANDQQKIGTVDPPTIQETKNAKRKFAYISNEVTELSSIDGVM